MTREEMNNYNKWAERSAEKKRLAEQQALIRPHLKPRQLPLDIPKR
jgi:hypothetical protein